MDLLSYLGTRYGGDFSKYSTKDLDALAEQLLSGKTLEELTANMKYYTYYRQAYGAAVLDTLKAQRRRSALCAGFAGGRLLSSASGSEHIVLVV